MNANEYRAARAQNPDVGALTIYRWSKTPKPHALDWDDSVGTATVGGWNIRATTEDDDDVDVADEYGTLTNDWQRGAFENPYWREWHRDGYGSEASGRGWVENVKHWHDDVCSSRHDRDGAARWYVDSSGETIDELRAYYRKYMSRHEAHTRALADMRKRADEARRVYADRYGQGRYAFAYVTATVSLAGVEVSSASYGGYSWERDYSKPLDPQLDAIVDDAVREALAEAPHNVDAMAIAEEQRGSTLRVRANQLREAFLAIDPSATFTKDES